MKSVARELNIFSIGVIGLEPLTAKNNFCMPMIITPEEAATYIADGLLRKSFEINFPKKFTFFLKLIKILLYALSIKITTLFNL